MDTATSKKELEQVYAAYRENTPRLKKELKRLLAEGEENNDLYLIGAVNYYFALISFLQGLRTNVLPYAIKATSMLEQTTDYDMISRSQNLLGIAYVAQEDYQSALAAYQAAYQTVCKHRHCTVRKEAVWNNIAECYYQMGDYKKGIAITMRHFDEAKRKAAEDPEMLVIYCINLSDCYESLENYEKAREVLGVAQEHIDRLEDGGVVCAIYARCACIAYKSGDVELGNLYADRTWESVGKCSDTYELHRDFEKIAHAQIRAGEYDRADRFADVLLHYSRHTGHLLDQIIAYRVQAHYFKTIHDSANALGYYAKLNTLYEKRREEEKATQLAMLKKIESTEREVKRLLRRIKANEESAEREPLTGLLNRTALLRVADEFVDAAKRRKKKLGGIFIDIDYFKEYNDTYGHAAGDAVIRAVADACLKEDCASVRFARYGGDEFFALVLGKGDEAVQEIAARICAALRDAALPHEKNPNGGRVTLSVGVANIDMAGSDNTILDIINYADKAVYQAKGSGKDAIFAFDLSRVGRKSPYVKVKY